MAIRSGRFASETGAKTEIIDGKKGGTYRIFNSGANTIEVRQSGVITPLANVPSDCSVDITPAGTIDVTSAGVMDGIYDLLTDIATVRNGRFKYVATTTEPSYLIVAPDPGKIGDFYRILNSGTKPFSVIRGGTNLTKDLEPKMTIDVEITKNQNLEIAPKNLGDEVEGIYCHLDQVAAVKSGRFKLDPNIPPNPNPKLDHIIIDTRNGGVDSFYRIFNSGDFPFLIAGVTGTEIEIQKGNSFDFMIPKGKQIITVKAKDYTTAPTPEPNRMDPIEGIYEYLGKA